MSVWILVIAMIHGEVTYGYKFLERSNCQKVGKDIVSISKKWQYSCTRKYIKIKN